MKKTFKKALSSFIVVCMLISAFAILSVSANSSLALKDNSSLSIIDSNGTKVILGLPEAKKSSELIANFESSSIVVSKDGETLADDAFVGTGTLITLGEDSAYVVVLGDVNGDGEVDSTDYLQIKNVFLKEYVLEGVYFIAADAQADGEIDTTDYLQIKGYFLGTTDLYPDINDDTSSEEPAVSEESSEAPVVSEEASEEPAVSEESSEAPVVSEEASEESSEEVTYTYILNKKSKKIHLASCSGAATISDKNRQGYNGDINELIAEGYTTCGTCKPEQYEEPSEDPVVSEESSEAPAVSEESSEEPAVSEESSEAPVVSEESSEESSEEVTYTYILNKKSKKIHLASCSGAATISDKNRQGYNGDINELIAEGYTTCGTCKPEQYEDSSEAPVVSEESSEAPVVSEESSEEKFINGYPASECFTWNGSTYHTASGGFKINDLADVETTEADSIAVALDKSFTTGKISAELIANSSLESDNDNGIIFGLEDVPLDYFWETGRSYYFLFISDSCSLYLAKIGYNDQLWTVLREVPLYEAGIVYSHGSLIKISAEVLEGGIINCYADDQLIFTCEDSEPLTGTGYGLRGEWAGVSWKSLTVESN